MGDTPLRGGTTDPAMPEATTSPVTTAPGPMLPHEAFDYVKDRAIFFVRTKHLDTPSAEELRQLKKGWKWAVIGYVAHGPGTHFAAVSGPRSLRNMSAEDREILIAKGRRMVMMELMNALGAAVPPAPVVAQTATVVVP